MKRLAVLSVIVAFCSLSAATGGGVDTRTLVQVLKVPLGFRVEVRDFFSGLPNYNVKVSGDLQNNVVFTGGFLIRF